MDSHLLGQLRARRPSIRKEWEKLLRLERVESPLAHPDTLRHLIGRTLTEVFTELRENGRHHAPAHRTGCASVRRDCACGRNPLLAYFLAGERALLEALVLAQAKAKNLPPEARDTAVTELYLVLRGIARREVKSFCRICRQRKRALPMGRRKTFRREKRRPGGWPEVLRQDYPPGGLPAEVSFGHNPAALRLLGPEDAPKLLEFFHSHTAETIRCRYGYPIAEMTPERAVQLVSVDQTADSAIGAFEADGRLIAVARCCRLPDGPSAEIAFVVHEQRRRLGIAGALLRALATLMRRRGVTRIVAEVETDNGPMLGLFRKAGAVFEAAPEGTTVRVTLDL